MRPISNPNYGDWAGPGNRRKALDQENADRILAWLYGDVEAAKERNEPDVEKWRNLGKPKP